MAFMEFRNDGLSNPTPVFCECFLLIQPHLFTLLFLPVVLGLPPINIIIYSN